MNKMASRVIETLISDHHKDNTKSKKTKSKSSISKIAKLLKKRRARTHENKGNNYKSRIIFFLISSFFLRQVDTLKIALSDAHLLYLELASLLVARRSKSPV